MCTAQLFSQELTSLRPDFTWIGSIPIINSWRQKARDSGLPGAEDRIHLRSFFDTIPECDGLTHGQTDARICRGILSAVPINETKPKWLSVRYPINNEKVHRPRGQSD